MTAKIWCHLNVNGLNCAWWTGHDWQMDLQIIYIQIKADMKITGPKGSIYKCNRRGPKIDLCGTPEVMGAEEEKRSLIKKLLFVKEDLSHCSTGPWRPTCWAKHFRRTDWPQYQILQWGKASPAAQAFEHQGTGGCHSEPSAEQIQCCDVFWVPDSIFFFFFWTVWEQLSPKPQKKKVNGTLVYNSV